MSMNNENNKEIPWYKRTFRWGQTNLTEIDPKVCDIEWWREYWHKTKVQGIIVNAGGIVAYYQSKFPLQYRAKWLGDRDLFGDFTKAAREEGLVVLARMDCNRATKNFYDAHHDWFAVDANGVPYRSEDRYFTCINSEYYKVYIPEVLKEIIKLYHPEGFTDNSWTGISRDLICYCNNCKRKFKEQTGYELPDIPDWNDPIYRRWVKWNDECKTENWDIFNKTTQEFGGHDCLWLGMINANPINNRCDLKEIGERSKIIMCDHQSKDTLNGFEQNSLNGNLLHGLAGWDKIIPESIANYVRGSRTFRLGSNPQKDTQKWITEGIAGGISPWYHHVGGFQEDRRQFKNCPPIMQWHEKNQEYLYNRLPIANIGLVWSQDNNEFYGQNEKQERAALPWRGFVKALIRKRIPFIPVNADHIGREAKKLNVLILPDLAAMSDSQCDAVKDFVKAGGSLIFTGSTALLNEWGEERSVFPFECITGIKPINKVEGAAGKYSTSWEFYKFHNYMRLPEERHHIFKDFEETDILPFGGKLNVVKTSGTMNVAATYIPEFPIYPPEFSWMRVTKTDIPVVFTGEHSSGGRIVYFAGDIDRCYGRANLPDHGDILANAVIWAAKDNLPIKVEGPGYIDCKLYRQERRLIIHLINLSGCNENPGYLEEYLPVGPITVLVNVEGFVPMSASLKVSGIDVEPRVKGSWFTIRIDSLVDHEMIVLE